MLSYINFPILVFLTGRLHFGSFLDFFKSLLGWFYGFKELSQRDLYRWPYIESIFYEHIITV